MSTRMRVGIYHWLPPMFADVDTWVRVESGCWMRLSATTSQENRMETCVVRLGCNAPKCDAVLTLSAKRGLNNTDSNRGWIDLGAVLSADDQWGAHKVMTQHVLDYLIQHETRHPGWR